MGPLDDQVLRPGALTVTSGGLDVAVYSHWYRALPLSCVVTVNLSVDGTAVEPEITVNGVRHTLASLREQAGEYWFTTDPLILHAPVARPGGQHHVEVELGLSIPYILIGAGRQPLLSASRSARILTARQP